MRPRVCVLVAVLASLVVAVLAAPMRPASAADPDIALVRSEEFGVFFLYDTSRWTISERTTEVGSDLVLIDDGEVFVTVWALDRPGFSPRDCIDLILRGLVTMDAVADVASLEESPGEPVIDDTGASASAELILTLAGDGVPVRYAARETCAELVPGASILYTSIRVPAAAWNAGRTFDPFPDPPGTGRSVYPWLSWHEPGSRAFAPVVDATGAAVGVIGRIEPCRNGAAQVLAVWAFAGGPGLVLDPMRVVAIEQTYDAVGEPGPLLTDPAGAEWLLPAGADRPLAVGPGEIAALRVPTERGGFATVYAYPEGAPRVELGSLGGGCGAGASPVRIDME